MKQDSLQQAKQVYEIEKDCIEKMADFFDEDAYSKAVEILKYAERIGATGCGHSGIICQHFAHLMCCIDQPARFISPAEAVHGGTGFLQKGDVCVFASRGGKTKELLPILDICKAKGKNSFVNIALISELDALACPNHIFADKTNGAGHACCHHTQSAVLIGVATALIKTGIIKELDGDITFMCVPAEEAIEGDFRRSLKEEGKIEFLSGKQEFIRLGMLEGVDVAICQHPVSAGKEEYYACGHTYNGIINKKIVFNGKSAHAALCPENGINALQAAVNAINNINSLREAFSDNDHIRIHYIITNGGSSSNIVPKRVEMEMGVRAKTVEKMVAVNKKVNEAIKLGAEVIGATVDIYDYNAYLPFSQNKELTSVYLKNAERFTDNIEDISCIHRGSSTDAGDFASVVPTIHPVYGGVHGLLHADDCYIENERLAYAEAVKPIVCTIIDLLSNNAAIAKNIKKDFKPEFADRTEYIKFYKKLFSGNL